MYFMYKLFKFSSSLKILKKKTTVVSTFKTKDKFTINLV